MQSLDRSIEWVCEKAALICGAMFIASAIYVSIDLIARKIFNTSFVGANEISGYVLAIASSWAFSYALLKRSHIRIDVVYRYFPLRAQAAIDVLSIAALAAFAAIFTWYASGREGKRKCSSGSAAAGGSSRPSMRPRTPRTRSAFAASR